MIIDQGAVNTRVLIGQTRIRGTENIQRGRRRGRGRGRGRGQMERMMSEETKKFNNKGFVEFKEKKRRERGINDGTTTLR